MSNITDYVSAELGVTVEGAVTRVSEFGAAVAEKIKTRIPSSFGIPYKTNDVLGVKPVWAVRLNAGALPNSSTKIVAIPANVMAVWGAVSERWLDLNNSYAYVNGANQSIPIPWVSGYTRNTSLFQDGFTQSIVLILNANSVSIITESDRSALQGVVTVKYCRADGR